MCQVQHSAILETRWQLAGLLFSITLASHEILGKFFHWNHFVSEYLSSISTVCTYSAAWFYLQNTTKLRIKVDFQMSHGLPSSEFSGSFYALKAAFFQQCCAQYNSERIELWTNKYMDSGNRNTFEKNMQNRIFYWAVCVTGQRSAHSTFSTIVACIHRSVFRAEKKTMVYGSANNFISVLMFRVSRISRW